jgi:hypothetical protein
MLLVRAEKSTLLEKSAGQAETPRLDFSVWATSLTSVQVVKRLSGWFLSGHGGGGNL